MSDQPAFTAPVPDQTGLVEPPARAPFAENDLPGEPAGDRKLVLESGMVMRERLVLSDRRADGVVSGAASPADVAFTVSISAALLNDADQVVTLDGRPVIAPAHEVTLTNEALGRLGSAEAVDAAILDAREVAAARAELAFKGALLAARVFAGRG